MYCVQVPAYCTDGVYIFLRMQCKLYYFLNQSLSIHKTFLFIQITCLRMDHMLVGVSVWLDVENSWISVCMILFGTDESITRMYWSTIAEQMLSWIGALLQYSIFKDKLDFQCLLQ